MNDNRRKLTDILKLLYENTDQEHYMDTYQIIDALEQMGHSRPDRKTVDANIKFMINELGLGITKERGKPNRYRWINRAFDLEELEMIADSLLTSRFITDKKCGKIIAKLKDLTSVHQASLLERDCLSSGRLKHVSCDTRSNIDIISAAIKQEKRVTFHMIRFNSDMEEVQIENGRLFDVSPISLAWCDSGFYMIGLEADTLSTEHYRINRMRDLEITNMNASQPPEDYDLGRYTSKVFDLFADTSAEVELSCTENSFDMIVDRFGDTFVKGKTVGDRVNITITTDISPAFYAWIFQTGGNIRITGPDWVRKGFESMISRQS
jgi:predicted DNA-binding transcriptional regulator YafY